MYLQIFNTQIYPFQNLSLGFFLKIFLKFRKFQPRYSYKIYSIKKSVIGGWSERFLLHSPVNRSAKTVFFLRPRAGHTHRQKHLSSLVPDFSFAVSTRSWRTKRKRKLRMTYRSVNDTGKLRGKKSECSYQESNLRPSITSSDALPLSYRRLVGAIKGH